MHCGRQNLAAQKVDLPNPAAEHYLTFGLLSYFG
jgi:hypothetical protein